MPSLGIFTFPLQCCCVTKKKKELAQVELKRDQACVKWHVGGCLTLIGCARVPDYYVLKLCESLQRPNLPGCHLQDCHSRFIFSVSILSSRVSKPSRRGSRTLELTVHRDSGKAKASNTSSSIGYAPEALEQHL